METTFASIREDKRSQENRSLDKRREVDEKGPGKANNTGNAKQSEISEVLKFKICSPKALFPYEIEKQADKQKENKEIEQKEKVKNQFKIKESKKEITETKKSGKNIIKILDEPAKEHEKIAYNLKVEKKEVYKNIKKVIIFIIILILNIQFNLTPNNNLKKLNVIKKIVKNYFIYIESTIKSKEVNIPKEINSMAELKKDKRSLKSNYIPKNYVNVIFINDEIDLIKFKYFLNKIKLKNTKNSGVNNNVNIKSNIIIIQINEKEYIYIIYKVNKVDKVDKKDNNIILINRNIINILNNIFNNSYLYKIKSFHHFSIHNNNKLNHINNFNYKYQNQIINYNKIRNIKLFLRILQTNIVKIVI